MKALKSLLLIASVGVLFTFSNCGGGGGTPEPVADQQLAKLTGTWNATSVVYQPPSAPLTTYPNFKLVLSGTKGAASFNYTTSGNPATLSPWKSSGTWAFGTDPVTMMVRDSGVDLLDMTYVVSATTLEIRFNFPRDGGYPNQGRTEQVKGDWVFSFTKQ
jgi:hypothetical protein